MKAISALILLIVAAQAHAGIGVLPIHIGVPFGKKVTELQLENQNDNEVVLDIRIKKWTTGETGVDVLTDTDAVLMSRPVVSIPPGKTATVRMFIKGREDANEDTYRVLVNDITPAIEGEKGVYGRLNLVLPMFVLNSKSTAGVAQVEDGKVANIGTRHIRISQYIDKNGKTEKTLRYVMPGKSIALPVAAGAKVEASDDIY